MFGKNALDIAMIIVALGAASAINRSGVKKKTIEDLKDLVETLESEIESLQRQNEEKDKKIARLQETVDGYSELVREGRLAGGNRSGSRYRATHSKATEDGSV